ncbi:MAG: YcxB family protein [Clostridiales bacterium]|jgi:hypothetical protein|nr:YcxB family protein [Clostridiales bacterium]
MESTGIIIKSRIGVKIFKRFAIFDGFFVKKFWRSPLIFFLIMAVAATVCFTQQGRSDQAAMLGTLLLGVGIGLPAAYVFSFFGNITAQVKKYGLIIPREFYTLKLTREPDGIAVSQPGGASARYKWAEVYGAYRRKGCVYLYIVKNKAFLLPEGQAEGGEDFWPFLSEMIPPGKLHI